MSELQSSRRSVRCLTQSSALAQQLPSLCNLHSLTEHLLSLVRGQHKQLMADVSPRYRLCVDRAILITWLTIPRPLHCRAP